MPNSVETITWSTRTPTSVSWGPASLDFITDENGTIITDEDVDYLVVE